MFYAFGLLLFAFGLAAAIQVILSNLIAYRRRIGMALRRMAEEEKRIADARRHWAAEMPVRVRPAFAEAMWRPLAA